MAHSPRVASFSSGQSHLLLRSSQTMMRTHKLSSLVGSRMCPEPWFPLRSRVLPRLEDVDYNLLSDPHTHGKTNPHPLEFSRIQLMRLSRSLLEPQHCGMILKFS